MLKSMDGRSIRVVDGQHKSEAVLTVANAAVVTEVFKKSAQAGSVDIPVLGLSSMVFTFSVEGGTCTVTVQGSTDLGATWKAVKLMDMGDFNMVDNTNDQTKIWMAMCAGLTHLRFTSSALSGIVSLTGTLN